MRGNFVGREYYWQLVANGWTPDYVFTVGEISDDSTAWERRRTGGLWHPDALPVAAVDRHFEKISDPKLWELVRNEGIDVCIQGGIGILKPDMFRAPKIGVLNVHPGDLPAYRGNSCPEWQLWNDVPIVATAHLIDEGVDTGPVVCNGPMKIPSDWSYEEIRANIYKHCAGVLVEALERIRRVYQDGGSTFATPQVETGAHYWPQIPDETLEALKQRLPRSQKVGT